jgi:hypothetical protein
VYNGSVELDIEAEIEKVLDVKNETKVFGAQVKSFDVTKGNFIGGLGTNTNLKNELYSSI